MPNVVIAFDEKDSTLGWFFQACKDDLDNYLKSVGLNYHEVNSDNLSHSILGRLTKRFDNFIFSAYSHGDPDSLLKAGRTQYVSVAQNGHDFANTFFYTFSCSSAKRLGRDIIDSGCWCFIGYKKDAYVWTGAPKVFVECANHGLIKFFEGYDTNTIMEAMREKYNDEIDNLFRTNFVAAAVLRDNRDALTIHGSNISLDSFT